jgi:nicotinate phosphoribosyltransferase
MSASHNTSSDNSNDDSVNAIAEHFTAAASVSAAPLPVAISLNSMSNNHYNNSSGTRDALSPPLCNFVDALLTESSGLLMCYAHWKNGRSSHPAVFDLYFRQHPFGGEFTIFAGLEEVLRFLNSFAFTDTHMTILSRKFAHWDKNFFTFLRQLDCSQVKLFAIKEGSVVFPRLPLLRVEGPLGICQMLESTLLVLVNYASLVATNAARHRLAVGPTKSLLEFGLRRAQGPDGAMSASRYAYMGGFDGTSNVKAATVFGIAMKGTHAHSYVVSFVSMSELKDRSLMDKLSGTRRDFAAVVLQYRSELRRVHTHEGELTAFISYAQAFPDGFLGLLDTFDTLESGIWNFICVALALHSFGYRPIGIRLDSGDLAYLSKECRKIFIKISEQYGEQYAYFSKLNIVASNDLSEKVLYALKEQGHEIDTCEIYIQMHCVDQSYKFDIIPAHIQISLSLFLFSFHLLNNLF